MMGEEGVRQDVRVLEKTWSVSFRRSSEEWPNKCSNSNSSTNNSCNNNSNKCSSSYSSSNGNSSKCSNSHSNKCNSHSNKWYLQLYCLHYCVFTVFVSMQQRLQQQQRAQ
ncbi:hypothetical protein GBAR_LOCUS15324 [Geodia barretti]|uniref:Uncharacterized protein n=1 Tax=Geodia barretti TaxID=519541 RepID=A0AA35WNB7_GEOBA|nr:hypothetical protein GBAR_LOCUS15324 [Geodia barretti]